MRIGLLGMTTFLVVAGALAALGCSSQPSSPSCPMTCPAMANGYDCSCSTGTAFACQCNDDGPSQVTGINSCVDGCYGRCMRGDQPCADDGPDGGVASDATPDPCAPYTSVEGTSWSCYYAGQSFQCNISLLATGDSPPQCVFDCGHDGIYCAAAPITPDGFQCDSYQCTAL